MKIHIEKIMDVQYEHRKLYPEKFIGNTRIPKCEHDKIRRLYRGGVFVKNIANEYGVSETQIYRIINKEII